MCAIEHRLISPCLRSHTKQLPIALRIRLRILIADNAFEHEVGDWITEHADPTRWTDCIMHFLNICRTKTADSVSVCANYFGTD